MSTISIPTPEAVANEIQRRKEEEERNPRIDDFLEVCVLKLYHRSWHNFICVDLPRNMNDFELRALSQRFAEAGWSCRRSSEYWRKDRLVITPAPTSSKATEQSTA